MSKTPPQQDLDIDAENDVHGEETGLMDSYTKIHPSWESVEPMSLDQIIDRIGLGWYFLRLLLVIGSVAVSEGAQIILITICTIMTQNQWNYNDGTRTALIAGSFLGVVAGSSLSGLFADRIGRRKPMLISLIVMTLLNLASAFSPNILVFIILRTALGIALGFFAPIGFTMVAENSPRDYRGSVIVLANAAMFVGELVACFIGYLVLDDYVNGNWRATILWFTVPFLIAIGLNLLFLDESLRYLMVTGRFEEAFTLMDKILKVNRQKNFTKLTELQKARLQAWEHKLEEEVTEEDTASVKALFKGEKKRLTFIIWFGWFASFFVYYGIIIYLPLTLSQFQEVGHAKEGEIEETPKNTLDISRISVSILVESLSTFIALAALHAKFISRQKFLIIVFILTGVISLLNAFYLPVNLYLIFITITKILNNTCTFYYYIFTLESYPTKNRATALGTALAFGKIATVVMPFICLGVSQIYFLAPYVVFSLLCFTASYSLSRLNQSMEEHELK